MAGAPHILVLLRDHLFAVRGHDVQEVVRLPALAPVAEVPAHVAGLANLRGDLVPVIDLAMRLGYEPMPLDPAQAVVILSRGTRRVGFVVDRVVGFENIADEQVSDAPEAPAGVVPLDDRVVRRIAQVGGRVATLLDPQDVLLEQRPEDLRRPGGVLAPRMAELPPEARAVLEQRAARLAQPPELLDEMEAPSLVRLRIGGEEFAVPAQSALEFVRLDDLTPVPCCPSHIAGHASLRGDIIVVVDLRAILGLAEPPSRDKLRAMLVRSPQGPPFGLLVDDVLDVAEAHDAQPVPAGGANYIRGSVRSGDGRIPVLDVERIAAARELVVQEDP